MTLAALLVFEISASIILSPSLRLSATQRLLPYDTIVSTPDIHAFSWEKPQHAQNADMSLSSEMLDALKHDPAIRSINPLAITNGSADRVPEGFPVFVFFEAPGTLSPQMQGGKSETVLLGSTLAQRLGTRPGHQLFIKNTPFSLDGVLPESFSTLDEAAMVILAPTSQLREAIHPSLALLSFSSDAPAHTTTDALSKRYTEVSFHAPSSLWRNGLPLLGIPLLLLVLSAGMSAYLLVSRDVLRKKKRIIIQTAIGAPLRSIKRTFLRHWLYYSLGEAVFAGGVVFLLWPSINTLLIVGKLITAPLVLAPLALLVGAVAIPAMTWLFTHVFLYLSLKKISFSVLRS